MSNIRPQRQIGELDQRIELQEKQFTDDGMGGTTSSWVAREAVWAQVRPKSGTERMHSDTLTTEGGFVVAIRNEGVARDVRESWRICWVDENRAMNIRFVEQRGRRALYLVMDVESGVAT